MSAIKEYEILVAGNSNGLQIPVNHRVIVTSQRVFFENGNWVLKLDVCTCTDDTHENQVLNDLFVSNKKYFDLGASIPSSGIKTLVKNNMNSFLDSEIGSENYTEII